MVLLHWLDIPDNIPIEDGDKLEEKKYNEIGELCLSGKHIFKEYFGEVEKTKCAKFVRNGKTFFRTGTLGFIDEDGYFTPTDRKSRFYIRSTGHKVYLDNVQRIIGASCDMISDVAAIKVPDEDELYIAKAYVVLKDGISPDDDTKKIIYDSLLVPIKTNDKLEQLKEYEIPKDIEFISELPRKAGTEKIDYILLEEKEKQKHTRNKEYIKKN